MKIVISRKGFDSQYGGIPSPVFPNGSVLPFPIPSPAGRPLRDLQHNGIPVHQLVHQLGGRLGPADTVHLDPDLAAAAVTRKPGWRPSLGQVGSAQKHLRNQGVASGDLFLFFGWYRPVEYDTTSRRWRYAAGSRDMHALFGWLLVQEVVQVTSTDHSLAQRWPWIADHPHVQHRARFCGENAIYVGAAELAMGKGKHAGAGLFSRWSPALRLTDPGQPLKSVWSVPAWMAPAGGRMLTYHSSPERWRIGKTSAQLRSVGKGQEFVIDVGNDPAPRKWLIELIERHA